MINIDRYLETNKANWNERVAVHKESRAAFYDIEGFLQGGSTLTEIEIEELGDVTGKSMLHLMCHFGLDSLSWARRGAVVTGVDFSQEAITLARDLAERSDLDTEFLCTDVYSLPDILSRRFDIVFASYGVLCWLPDFGRFMEIASQFLERGGTFLLVDMHPFIDIFEYDESKGDIEIQYPYFHAMEPEECCSPTSYVNKKRKLVNSTTYQWSHDMGSLVRGIVGNGLELTSLREYPFCFFERFPNMTQDSRDRWVMEGGKKNLPLLFMVKAARKP